MWNRSVEDKWLLNLCGMRSCNADWQTAVIDDPQFLHFLPVTVTICLQECCGFQNNYRRQIWTTQTWKLYMKEWVIYRIAIFFLSGNFVVFLLQVKRWYLKTGTWLREYIFSFSWTFFSIITTQRVVFCDGIYVQHLSSSYEICFVVHIGWLSLWKS